MSVGATPLRGPLPAVAIQHVIQKKPPIGAAADVPHPSPSSPLPLLLRVEVETRQGYVYEGKLLSLDDNYNINLVEATVWRDRLCDVECALLTAGGFPAPVKSLATRRRYVGSVFIRSSSLLMVRFLQVDGSAGESADSARGGATAVLKTTFKSMATKVKRQINLERQKNRMERRQRRRLVKRTPETTAITTVGDKDGWRTRDGRKKRKGEVSS